MAASASSWNAIQPFTEVVSLPYSATFDASQFALIKLGHIPQEMEDHWFIYFEEPYLNFHRSWTGAACYRVTFATDERGVRVVEAGFAKAIADHDVWGLEWHAQLLDFLISHALLGEAKPFPPDPPHVLARIRVQHPQPEPEAHESAPLLNNVPSAQPSKTKVQVWLTVVACTLGIVLGRYVGKYVFLGFGSDPAHFVRGALHDNIFWGGIYGGLGASFGSWIAGSKLRLKSFWLALVVSLVVGVLLVFMALMKIPTDGA